MSEWQPIETAPRDGSLVMTAKESAITPGHFPYPLKTKFVDGFWLADFGNDRWGPFDPQPTHWLPE